MTEMKYIFPKQLQSVAALAFIAVLIALLLILTVMVHMRNRKLKRMLEEQMAERRLLDKICSDFTAVYMDIMMPRMNVHLAKPLDAEKVIVALKQCMADNSDVKLHEDL